MSVTLTISNLEDETFRRLQAEAQRSGADLQTVARKVLAENLPPESTPESTNGKHRDVSTLAGTWTEDEYQQFMAAIADFGRIDPEMCRPISIVT
jgi:plasmid stability protein